MLGVRLRLNRLEEVEPCGVVRPEKLWERLFRATQELFEWYGGPTVLASRDEG